MAFKTIIEPFKIKMVEPLRMTTEAERVKILKACGCNVFNIKADDVLILEASPDSLEEAIGIMKLEYVGKGKGKLEDDDLRLSEVVVQESSSLAGSSAMSARLPTAISPRSGSEKCRASLPVMEWIASSILILPVSRTQ